MTNMKLSDSEDTSKPESEVSGLSWLTRVSAAPTKAPMPSRSKRTPIARVEKRSRSVAFAGCYTKELNDD